MSTLTKSFMAERRILTFAKMESKYLFKIINFKNIYKFQARIKEKLKTSTHKPTCPHRFVLIGQRGLEK